jgi:hypothetical protein
MEELEAAPQQSAAIWQYFEKWFRRESSRTRGRIRQHAGRVRSPNDYIAKPFSLA